MSTLAARAMATGAYRCKVLDFEGNCIRIVNVNADDLAQARINTRAAGYRLVPVTRIRESIKDIMNTSPYGHE